MEKIILASSSPRRKEILDSLGIPFTAIHPDIDETIFDHTPPEQRVVLLAEAKAKAGDALVVPASASGIRFLLAADTLVALPQPEGWQTIGKPETIDDARRMLTQLSGRTHRVFTGLCLLDRAQRRLYTTLSKSSVTFATMSMAEIDYYSSSGEWVGAAGAYRVQGIGSYYIEELNGSWSGVMGLPIRELYGILTDAGYDFVFRSAR